MPLSPLLEKLLAGHAPCSIKSFEMLQENLKNQRDSVKKGFLFIYLFSFA